MQHYLAPQAERRPRLSPPGSPPPGSADNDAICSVHTNALCPARGWAGAQKQLVPSQDP